MQTVPAQFNSYAEADLRPLSWHLLMSFQKNEVDKVWPATAQPWDKYQYREYTNRIINVEWSRQTEFPSSVALAMADVTLNNYDNYFTPNGGSEIQSYILPRRPIKIFAGFGGIMIPQFVGLTEKMPIIDEKDKTVTFHCIDFLGSLLNKPLDEEEMFINETVDNILLALFEGVGLTASQLDLDAAFTTIDFAPFSKGMKLGTAVRRLMEVEQGRLFMTEDGIITFRNRQNYSTTPVLNFNAYDNIIDMKTRDQDDIINVVQISGKRIAVQPNTLFGTLTRSIEVLPGETQTIWIDFSAPVTGVDTPVYEDDATTSFFSVNTAEDGTGSANATDVTLTSATRFASSYKMLFTNAGADTLYITALELYATPAVPVEDIYVREEDESSVESYDEQVYQINDNDLFQSATDAQTKALVILGDFASFGAVQQLDLKGNMALQLDDPIRINIFDRIDDYKITKITNRMSFPAKFTQLLTVKNFEPHTYFTIGVSAIGGTDELFP